MLLIVLPLLSYVTKTLWCNLCSFLIKRNTELFSIFIFRPFFQLIPSEVLRSFAVFCFYCLISSLPPPPQTSELLETFRSCSLPLTKILRESNYFFYSQHTVLIIITLSNLIFADPFSNMNSKIKYYMKNSVKVNNLVMIRTPADCLALCEMMAITCSKHANWSVATILSCSGSYVTVGWNPAKNHAMAVHSYRVLNERAVSELAVEMDL